MTSYDTKHAHDNMTHAHDKVTHNDTVYPQPYDGVHGDTMYAHYNMIGVNGSTIRGQDNTTHVYGNMTSASIGHIFNTSHVS